MLSGHGFPSRKRGLLSSAKTPNTGGPNPVVVRIIAPASASFLPSSRLTKFLLGKWTNSFTGVDARDEGRRADRMNLDEHAGLFPLVDDGAEHLDLLIARPGHRRQRDFARELHAHLR